MYITKLKMQNFKCYDEFEIEFNNSVNVLVGNNSMGKSTILEAIHLCLTGFFRGKYLKNNLTQDIFNKKIVEEYIENIKTNKETPLPVCYIELYFEDSDPIMMGKENSDNENSCCLSYIIEFDSKYSEDYKCYINSTEVYSLPIEYYTVNWKNSAGREVTGRTTPIKSIIVDTSECNLRNSSDNYVSKIIRDNLEKDEIIGVSQLYRDVRSEFIEDELMKKINNKLSKNMHILDTKVQIDVESLRVNDWEKSIITKINSIPFEQVGKGIQSAVKIELSLNSKSADSANVLLIEEPENHLAYSKMNKLINEIIKVNKNKQVFIATHSSFVANKLNLKNLILLNEKKYIKFTNLSKETYNFFMKKPGYDTLRFLLCEKAILVEGDADELILQKAYLNKYGHLPIEDENDVISVGNTFLRFLEIADMIKKYTVIITDNDGKIENLEKKFKNYIGVNKKDYIKINYDSTTHIGQGNLKAKNNGEYNYDTLEPCMVRANGLDVLNKILKKNASTEDEIIEYMVNNKTECALMIYDTEEQITFPEYIEDAIRCVIN